jgi:hypothetical protein
MSSQNINGQSVLVQSILSVAYSKDESNGRYYLKYFPGIPKTTSTYSAQEIDGMVGGGGST